MRLHIMVQSGIRTGFPGKWWSHYGWKYPEGMRTWHLGHGIVMNMLVLG